MNRLMTAGLVSAVAAGVSLVVAAPVWADDPPPTTTTTAPSSTTVPSTTSTTEPPTTSTTTTVPSSTTSTTQPEEDLPIDAQPLSATLLPSPVTAGTEVTVRPKQKCSLDNGVAQLVWSIQSADGEHHAVRGRAVLDSDGGWAVNFRAPSHPAPMGVYSFTANCMHPDADLQPAAVTQYYDVDFEVVAAGDTGSNSPGDPSNPSDPANPLNAPLAQPAVPIVATPNFVG